MYLKLLCLNFVLELRSLAIEQFRTFAGSSMCLKRGFEREQNQCSNPAAETRS